MQIKTCFTNWIGSVLLGGLTTSAAQEAATLSDRLWSPTSRMELVDPHTDTDGLWIDHTTLLNGTTMPGTLPEFRVRYNFGHHDELKELGTVWLSVLDPEHKSSPGASDKSDNPASGPGELYLQGHLCMHDGLEWAEHPSRTALWREGALGGVVRDLLYELEAPEHAEPMRRQPQPPHDFEAAHPAPPRPSLVPPPDLTPADQ